MLGCLAPSLANPAPPHLPLTHLAPTLPLLNAPPHHPPCTTDSFPFEWIKKKWREAFHVTAMATSGTQWAVVMSRGAGYLDQVRGSAIRVAAGLGPG